MRISRGLKWVASSVFFLALSVGLIVYNDPVRVFTQATQVHMWFDGARSHWTRVEGYRVHYYTMGPESGPPVVLIHGLGARAEDWAHLAPYFARAGFRVFLPDLPGYGQSDRPTNFSYSIADEANVVVGFLDALHLKEADLGGWSMGGWIVQLVAAKHPDRVRRLILFDSAGIYQAPNWNTGLFTPTTASEIEQLNALLMPNPPAVPEFIAADILRMSQRHAWVIQRALASMLTGRDATDGLLPQLKMPVMVVWGDLDRITPLEQGQKIHALVPRSQLDVIPGCGHLAPSQCSLQIGPAVVQFLKQ
ncbi:MAG: alpha/beta fold hydrolase [Terracidiphilus sp.]